MCFTNFYGFYLVIQDCRRVPLDEPLMFDQLIATARSVFKLPSDASIVLKHCDAENDADARLDVAAALKDSLELSRQTLKLHVYVAPHNSSQSHSQDLDRRASVPPQKEEHWQCPNLSLRDFIDSVREVSRANQVRTFNKKEVQLVGLDVCNGGLYQARVIERERNAEALLHHPARFASATHSTPAVAPASVSVAALRSLSSYARCPRVSSSPTCLVVVSSLTRSRSRSQHRLCPSRSTGRRPTILPTRPHPRLRRTRGTRTRPISSSLISRLRTANRKTRLPRVRRRLLQLQLRPHRKTPRKTPRKAAKKPRKRTDCRARRSKMFFSFMSCFICERIKENKSR